MATKTFDSKDMHRCAWCEMPISGLENMIVYGVGSNQYIRVFHPECDNARKGDIEARFHTWQLSPDKRRLEELGNELS